MRNKNNKVAVRRENPALSLSALPLAVFDQVLSNETASRKFPCCKSVGLIITTRNCLQRICSALTFCFLLLADYALLPFSSLPLFYLLLISAQFPSTRPIFQGCCYPEGHVYKHFAASFSWTLGVNEAQKSTAKDCVPKTIGSQKGRQLNAHIKCSVSVTGPKGPQIASLGSFLIKI